MTSTHYSPLKLVLANCVVTVEDELVTTAMLSGDVVHGVPHDTEAYRQTAAERGYGDDLARMNRCHEVAHTLLAHWFGLRASPVLERIGAGERGHTAVTRLEEDAVAAVERFANAVGVDLLDVAMAAGDVGAKDA